MSTPGALQPSEFKQISTEVGSWLWGTVQGAWNEKQTASQIIVDAVIGMIPLVGQGTAVRDLLAVGTGLADSPAKRENVWDWVLFAILLMALVPVIGGVLKGVGRLTLRAAREAAENSAKIAALADDIVALLNRVGHKDAVKWFKALDFMKYEAELVGRCRALCDTVILCINRYALKFAKVLPQSFVSRMEALSGGFNAIKVAADKMIPQALKELNAYLKKVQAHIVAGGVPPPGRALVYQAQTGKAVKTYADEARLIESGAAKTIIRAGKYPQNLANVESVGKVYAYKKGFPNLLDPRGKVTAKVGKDSVEYFSPIAAATGPIKNVDLGEEGVTLFRAFGQEGSTHGVKVGKSSPAGMWWGIGEPPKTATEWRQKSAVLDEFNRNGMVSVIRIPKGVSAPACTSTVSEQYGKGIAGQYLEGGGKQAVVDFSLSSDMADAQRAINALAKKGGGKAVLPNGIQVEVRQSGWKGINGKIGYGAEVIPGAGVVERLGVTELQTKAAREAGAATAKDQRAAPNR